MAVTTADLIEHDTLLKYEVKYECVADDPFGGKVGAYSSKTFDRYSLDIFARAAPSNWEIREINQFEVADR